jgi:hypothetical protein
MITIAVEGIFHIYLNRGITIPCCHPYSGRAIFRDIKVLSVFEMTAPVGYYSRDLFRSVVIACTGTADGHNNHHGSKKQFFHIVLMLFFGFRINRGLGF